MALYNYFNQSQNHSEISTVAVRGTLEVRENLELEETSFMDSPSGILCCVKIHFEPKTLSVFQKCQAKPFCYALLFRPRLTIQKTRF